MCPEIVEYHKLRRQLVTAWRGAEISNLSAPLTCPNPKKYVQGDFSQFRTVLTSHPITDITRHGKMLFVHLASNQLWQIHLSSTGWFMPGNEAARAKGLADPIHRNFLHGINPRNVRVRFHFQDGQRWDYHDSRTWGKWWLRPPNWEQPDVGPDWLKETTKAIHVLIMHQSRRTAKDVLCDQHLTAGLGNYLACETLHLAGIHPHTRWHLVTARQREVLTQVINNFLPECLARADHGHWNVFDKAGEPCPRHPNQPIGYAKDGTNGKRGSYFCSLCQKKKLVPET